MFDEWNVRFVCVVNWAKFILYLFVHAVYIFGILFIKGFAVYWKCILVYVKCKFIFIFVFAVSYFVDFYKCGHKKIGGFEKDTNCSFSIFF